MTEGATRPRRSSEDSRRRILEAAEGEFAAKGYDGARLGAIARAAGVQQALIHHYFADKDGLYREIIARVLSSMSDESLDILASLARAGEAKKRLAAGDIRVIVEAFVEVLVRFYAAHGAIASILRYEAQQTDSAVRKLFIAKVQPIFDAVVDRIEMMRERGEIRDDVDARHTCVSAIAMIGAPFQEEHLLAALWDVDVRSPSFLRVRKREVCATLLARILP